MVNPDTLKHIVSLITELQAQLGIAISHCASASIACGRDRETRNLCDMLNEEITTTSARIYRLQFRLRTWKTHYLELLGEKEGLVFSPQAPKGWKYQYLTDTEEDRGEL